MDQKPTERNRAGLFPQRSSDLTPRQAQIRHFYFKQPNEILVARALGLSPHTVRNQIAAIMGKMGVGSRAELMQLMQESKRDD